MPIRFMPFVSDAMTNAPMIAPMNLADATGRGYTADKSRRDGIQFKQVSCRRCGGPQPGSIQDARQSRKACPSNRKPHRLFS